MDNITHTLIGIAVAKSGISRRLGRGSTLALAVASNLPDIDVLSLGFKGRDFILYRRMFTHSFLGMLILALISAFVFRMRYRNISYGSHFLLFVLGISLHIFFDLVNSYGVVLLYPFSMNRYELSWIYIIDLAIWAILITPLIVSRFKKSNEWVWRMALILLGIYVCISSFAHSSSELLLKKRIEEEARPIEFKYVFPEPLGPHRFRGVVKEGPTYRTFLIYPLRGKCELINIDHTQESLEVEKARQTKLGKRLEWFFLAPVWKVLPQTNEIEVFDLRFRSEVLGLPQTSFTYQFSSTGEPLAKET